MVAITTRSTGGTAKGSALTHAELDQNFINLNDGKQDTLVSGTNVKSLNGNSLIGSGNLVLTGGLIATSVKTGAYDAVADDLVRVDSTAASFTVTLPATPVDGTRLGLLDVANACATNPVLLSPASGTIEGDASGVSVNIAGAYVYLIYNSTTTNWKVASTPVFAGDLSSGLTSSADSEIALFSGTGGKTIKRAALTGLAKVTAGVLSAAVAGTDYSTPTGTETLSNKTLASPLVTGYTETVYALSGTVIDPANGTVQTKTLSANTTFTESLADGQSVILGITAGAYSVTWPSTTWAKVGGSGVAPTLTSTGVNWVVLWQVGGVLRGSFLGTA